MTNLLILPITVSLLTSNPLGSPFVFPEDNEVQDSVQKWEVCPDGADYCQHLSSYPASKIARALQKEDSGFLRNMLRQGNNKTKPRDVPEQIARKALPLPRTEFKQLELELELIRPRLRKEQESEVRLRTLMETAKSRTEPELEYEKVCQSSTEDIFPQRAKNKDGQYRFIVNGGEGLEEYVQTVSVSKCVGAGLSCRVDSHDDTECRQEYIEHKLVSLDQSGQQLEVDTFPLPSGCSCYKKTHFL